MSNIINVNPEEYVVNAMPVYNWTSNIYITAFSKNGMIKRTKLENFKVQRYSKAINMMNLKEKDKVVDVTYSVNTNVLIVTKNGYGLWYNINEVNPVGIKAAGVKAINLRDDEVVSGILFNKQENEFITIITDKGTAKRMRFTDIDIGSRGNRGLLFMKTIKSNPSKVVKVYVTNPKNSIIVTSKNKNKEIKLTEIPIMDRYSNGSTILKEKITDSHLEPNILSKEDFVNLEYIEDKKPEQVELNFDMLNKQSLKQVDDEMVIINNFLDNIEGK
jgi:topoisomerase-4 subunit A